MTENDSAEEKRIAVDYLSFGAKTAKRVAWEAWEFSVEAPLLIRVTNASYGFEKDDHSYLVGVEDRDDVLVPAECECKADLYSEEYDCKHKVALATVGGKLVLEAALDFPMEGQAGEGSNRETMADKLRADGGLIAEEKNESSHDLYASEPDECDCRSLPGDFPCWDCVRDGKSDLPE